MEIDHKKETKKAFLLGAICMFSYLACYYARNILSAVSPKMVESSQFTLEFIGLMSTINMLTYAMGQLLNGALGDFIKAKYMVSGGLILSAVCNFIIPFSSYNMILFSYSLSGFFLAMIFAPITKVVAENTLPHYASRCCLGFTFASFLGNPLAGLAAIFFNWDVIFVVSGFILVLMGIMCFIFFSLCEKKGYIVYRIKEKSKKQQGKLKTLLEHSIIKFTVISILTGIIRTSVVFWVPTYTYQYLGFSAEISATIFTVATLIKSFSPYVNNLLIYERILKRDMDKMLKLMFSISAVSFLLLFIIKQPFINIGFLLLGLIASAGASTMMFSVYCPSLGKTGLTSTATGFLDFVSYVAAAVANQFFASFSESYGWGYLTLIWSSLMVCGFIASVVKKKEVI